MKTPSYLEIRKDITPIGSKFAHFIVAFKRCNNCGAKIAALSNPCSFEHMDKVLQFSSDMQHKFGMTSEQLISMHNRDGDIPSEIKIKETPNRDGGNDEQ